MGRSIQYMTYEIEAENEDQARELAEELDAEVEIEKEAYDMSNMNEDYTDGNYDLDEYSQEYLEEEYY